METNDNRDLERVALDASVRGFLASIIEETPEQELILGALGLNLSLMESGMPPVINAQKFVERLKEIAIELRGDGPVTLL